MPRFDFHLHTHFSDGTLSPQALIAKLKAGGVEYFSITDHDSLKAYDEIKDLPLNGTRFLPGIEINTSEPTETLHILGFGGRILTNEAFLAKIAFWRGCRQKRALAMVERLRGRGIDITMEDVLGFSREAIGRPHVADALRKKGAASSRSEAFKRYLLKGRPGYVQPMGPNSRDAIESIVQAGGVAVLAHPGIAQINEERLVALMDMGLGGIEVYHCCHSAKTSQDYFSLARKYGLYMTCGSDYHGPETGREELVAYEFDRQFFNKFLEAVA